MLLSAPIALQQAKIAVDAGMQCDLDTGLRLESRAYAVTIPTEDRQEGLEAFREKTGSQISKGSERASDPPHGRTLFTSGGPH